MFFVLSEINLTKLAHFIDDHGERIAVLEEQFTAFKKVAEETTRTSLRVDNIESSVNRFTGSLKSFLSRIQIDNRLRLVPDTRRVEGSHSPLLAITRSASPVNALDFAIEDDADVGVASSSAPDTWTTPSNSHREAQMQIKPLPAPIQAPAPAPALATAPALPSPQVASLDTLSTLPEPVPATAPTINMIPATPQGSSSLLGAQEGRITRS